MINLTLDTEREDAGCQTLKKANSIFLLDFTPPFKEPKPKYPIDNMVRYTVLVDNKTIYLNTPASYFKETVKYDWEDAYVKEGMLLREELNYDDNILAAPIGRPTTELHFLHVHGEIITELKNGVSARDNIALVLKIDKVPDYENIIENTKHRRFLYAVCRNIDLDKMKEEYLSSFSLQEKSLYRLFHHFNPSYKDPSRLSPLISANEVVSKYCDRKNIPFSFQGLPGKEIKTFETSVFPYYTPNI